MSQATAADRPSAQQNIFVEAEWAPLKECVYGSPDAWVLPIFLSDVKLRAQGPFGEFWAKNQGRDVKEADPELFAEYSGQIRGAIDLLERLGVRVQVAGEISPANRKFPARRGARRGHRLDARPPS